MMPKTRLPESTLNLTPELGMYAEARKRGLSLTAYLEELDPTPEGYPLDAFERQLAKYGLKVQGPDAVRLEEFFKTTESRVLFPEFINRAVRKGLETGKRRLKLQDIVAERTEVDAKAASASEVVEPPARKKGAARTGELGEFPTVEIKLKDKTVTLKKYGRLIKVSYEAMAFMKANVLARQLEWIGQQIRNQMVSEAVNVLMATQNQDTVATLGTLTYDDLVDFTLNFEPYESVVWFAQKSVVATILKMQEFKDAFAGFNFQATGDMISPMGNVLRIEPSMPANVLGGLDRAYALEMFTARDWQMMVEEDKVISAQYQEIAISTMVGFDVMHAGAVRKLKIA